MKKTRSLAIGILTAAAGLLFYCGSFYVKSYLENQQAAARYGAIREVGLEEKPMSSIKKQDAPVVTQESSRKRDGAGNQKARLPKKETIDSSFGISWKALRKMNPEIVAWIEVPGADISYPVVQGTDDTYYLHHSIDSSFGISWKALRKMNPEIVAWIEVPGADISYPVVQGTDDTYYLHHSFSREKDAFGTIFLGSVHKKDFQESHCFLYGHNMEGNMMFANLNRYEEKEFWEECPEFYVYTPEKLLNYRIFSVQQAAALSPGFQYGYELGSKAYQEQLKTLSGNSLYKTEVSLDAEAPMVTLVTCNSSLDEKIRMTVHGILVKEWSQDSPKSLE